MEEPSSPGPAERRWSGPPKFQGDSALSDNLIQPEFSLLIERERDYSVRPSSFKEGRVCILHHPDNLHYVALDVNPESVSFSQHGWWDVVRLRPLWNPHRMIGQRRLVRLKSLSRLFDFVPCSAFNHGDVRSCGVKFFRSLALGHALVSAQENSILLLCEEAPVHAQRFPVASNLKAIPFACSTCPCFSSHLAFEDAWQSRGCSPLAYWWCSSLLPPQRFTITARLHA